MAQLNPTPDSAPASRVKPARSGNPLARQQYAAIARLRWRGFVNSLRARNAAGELTARILGYPLLALFILGPAVGSGFFAWTIVNSSNLPYLSILLWVIFLFWQFFGLNTTASGPGFAIESLARFPIRYRDYLLIRLSLGLLDPATLAGFSCLAAMTLGIGLAQPALAPWAAAALFTYALANLLFARMSFIWLEKWLTQRRTRELVTGLILAFSLAGQIGVQAAQRLNGSMSMHHRSPFFAALTSLAIGANRWLPPGLVVRALDHALQPSPSASFASLAAVLGVALYAAVCLFALHRRLRAEYSGESLSEAPARAIRKRTLAAASTRSPSSGELSILTPQLSAQLAKEGRYLARSGPRLYVLAMPVFMVFVFSARSMAIATLHLNTGPGVALLFSYGCVYQLLIFASLLYNAFGSDGAGIQFYQLAPLPIRNVLLAKNIFTAAILAAETILVYIAASLLSKPPAPDLAAATLAWLAGGFFWNSAAGNRRSITAPKAIDLTKMRGQNTSPLSGLVSAGITLLWAALGAGLLILSHLLFHSFWPAAAALLLGAAGAFAVYWTALGQLDPLAASHGEELLAELCKT